MMTDEGKAREVRATRLDKPLPVPTSETAPYWEGCRQHQLRIQRCRDCSQYQFFPRIYCSKCFSDRVEWVNASGRAKVLSFTVVRRPVSAAFANASRNWLAVSRSSLILRNGS